MLILDSDGGEIAVAGIATQRDLAARIAIGWRRAQGKHQQVFVVDGDERSNVVVVALPMPDASVLIAMRREGRDPLFELVNSVEFAGDILVHFLTNPFEALTVVDREGILRYMSPVHEHFFGEQPGNAIGQHVTSVIENTQLHRVAISGQAEIGSLQEMRGVTRVVSRHPIHNCLGETVGAIGQVMFKGPEQLQTLSSETSKLKSEIAHCRRELRNLRNRSYGLDEMVGESAAMVRLKQQIVKVAPLDVPVLLTGESGTGKELAAHAIHKLSARREATMVEVNAAALPATLVESELFGYEGGAFTGAERKGRKGKIEQADRGTLFFDEIGDMPADVQVKLLRVLQDGSFQRVGGQEVRSSDFRLVSASNRVFEAMIADGTFRLDLFYRIGVVTIRLPALRERLEDIPLLAERVLDEFARKHRQRRKSLSDEALDLLMRQRWPGNVRQLMHTVECAAIFSESGIIRPADLGLTDDGIMPGMSGTPHAAAPARDIALAPQQGLPGSTRVDRALEQVEAQLIRQAMVRCRGNKKRVAIELGISRSYLYKRLAQLDAT
ncbi:sigma-54 interaction domain-containing protein [Burkholderia pseudomultivorans]|uniref:Fis family transcriptional regulator n=1 Tax=Burkholderia pseudomultivorans TaxID=1207504 RepID=A0A132ED99_9BURK|nr:sigma 54-interacting transcriptional regulator [Burkholderia pseudomultivorans]KWF24856.1 Fis family transcriptional regulator [Burkholderia pseudomultivorans]